jgi:hypothetical protein
VDLRARRRREREEEGQSAESDRALHAATISQSR